MDLTSYFYLISQTGINWIDIIIAVVLIIYAIEGYAAGFLNSLYDLATFTVAFVSGLLFYNLIAKLILYIFKIPQGFANAIGFFIIAFVFEIILSLVFKKITLLGNYSQANKVDISKEKIVISKLLGVVLSVISGLILISFMLTIITTLPLSLFLKQAISSSAIGNLLVANTQGLSKDVNSIFGKAMDDSLSFLTVEPQGNQVVSLNFKTNKISTDAGSENKMFNLVNFERKKVGLSEFESSYDLQRVARVHCEDMLKNGYFSHYSLSGYSPFDRLAQYDINYNFAGENLAFSPNVDLAMKGLMQSKGHRDNILSKDFDKVGIGIVDGGIYGQMYCQEFTD
jgi:uncharacterized protein YkwD